MINPILGFEFGILAVMRMMWWFIILGTSGVVAIFAAIAIYVRVRGHIFAAKTAPHEVGEDLHSAAGPEVP